MVTPPKFAGMLLAESAIQKCTRSAQRPQVRRLEAALAEAQAGRAADAAAAHRLHEDQRARLAAAGRRLQTLVSCWQHRMRVRILSPHQESIQCGPAIAYIKSYYFAA